MIRRSLAMFVIALFGTNAMACGADSREGRLAVAGVSGHTARGGSRIATTEASRAGRPKQQPRRDYDNDNDAPAGVRYDSDDNAVLDFGHQASEVDRVAITALIRGYYASAVARDGVRACSQLYSLLAESVPDEYGQVAATHGTTCAAIMATLFAQRHRALSSEVVTLRVSRVRVSGDRGVALVRFGASLPARRILVHRERGAWKMAVLFDFGVP